MSWWSTLDSNDKSFWTNYIIRRLSLAVYCLYATNSGMPRCCIIFAPVFHTFISGKDHYKTRSLSLSLNQLPYRNKMAENRKSRAGARRRCEVEDGCDEMVADTTYYKHKALGCKRRRCDSNDQEGATYRYVQAQLFSWKLNNVRGA